MKKLIALSLAALLALCLCSCGDADFSLDTDALVSELRGSSLFADSSMQPVQEMFLRTEYDLSTDLISAWQALRGTMITGEDIVVITCETSEDAKTIAGELEAYQQRQYDLYSTYSPEGAARIQSAIILQKGVYAVYVAADDAAGAEQLLNGYFG